MNNIQNILSNVSVIDLQYRTLEENKEQFNIFTVFQKYNDEKRLHSRFIEVLLKHKDNNLNNLFLNYFLKTVDIDNFDISKVYIYPEYQTSKNRFIDILIKNDKQQAIIIENKIFAGDCNHEDEGQLEHYLNQLLKVEKYQKENTKVLYLSIDGHEPSPESLGKYETLENMNGKTIDYEHEIQNWLNLCLKECVNQPFLRKSIIQYSILIKRMTNDINIQERLGICDLIAKSEENMSSAKLLIENFKHVKWHTVRNFWNELAEMLKSNNFSIISSPTDNNITKTTHYECYKKSYYNNFDYGIWFKTQNYITLYIWNGTANSEYCLFWGARKEDIPDLYIEKFEKYFENSKNGFTEGTDFSKWFDFEEKYEDNECIYFGNFSYLGTYNLINKDYRTKMIGKIFKEIKEFVDVVTK
jgi:hypothetical protein